jgi:hypothetical protein
MRELNQVIGPFLQLGRDEVEFSFIYEETLGTPEVKVEIEGREDDRRDALEKLIKQIVVKLPRLAHALVQVFYLLEVKVLLELPEILGEDNDRLYDSCCGLISGWLKVTPPRLTVDFRRTSDQTITVKVWAWGQEKADLEELHIHLHEVVGAFLMRHDPDGQMGLDVRVEVTDSV